MQEQIGIPGERERERERERGRERGREREGGRGREGEREGEGARGGRQNKTNHLAPRAPPAGGCMPIYKRCTVLELS